MGWEGTKTPAPSGQRVFWQCAAPRSCPCRTPCTSQCHRTCLLHPTQCHLLKPPGHPCSPSLLWLQVPLSIRIPAEAAFLLPCSHLSNACSPSLLLFKVLLLNLVPRAGVQLTPAPSRATSCPVPQTTTSLLCVRFNFYLPAPSTARLRFLI